MAIAHVADPGVAVALSRAGIGAGAGAGAGAARGARMATKMVVGAVPSRQQQLPSFDGLRTSHSSPSSAAASSSAVSFAPTAKSVHAPLQTANVPSTLMIRAEKKALKRRQIILVEDIPDLGKTGEIVTVKQGYFRNFLSPYGKAKMATAELLKSIKLEQERIENEKRKVKEEAELIAKQFLAAGYFNVRRKSGQGKQIFGSVTSQDIVDIIKAQTGRDVDKRVVTVPEIREVGQYTVDIKLHPEVVAQVRVNVIAK